MAFMFAARWPITLYTGVFRGLQKQLQQNSISAISVTIRVVIAIILVKYISQEITIFLLWQAISCVMEIGLLLLFAWKELNKISGEKPRVDLQIINKVWKFALSFNLVGVLGMILSQAGIFISSKIVSLSEIGYYSVASTAAGSLTLIAYSVGTAVYPVFAAETERNNIYSVSNEFHRYVRTINYFIFGFGSILTLFPSLILYLWIRDWNVVLNTVPILVFLAGAAFFNSMANTSYLLLIASGNTKIPLLCNLGNFLIFIPALLIFIPKYGIIAAAVIWLLGNIISYIVYTISVEKLFLNRNYRYYLTKDILPYLIGVFVWFFSVKIFFLIWYDRSVSLAVILLATVGYFISLSPLVFNDFSLNKNGVARN